MLSFLPAAAQNPTPFSGKQLYIPAELRSNRFESDTARWSYSRMALTDNFAIFWERGFGNDLKNPPALEGKPMHVDMDNLIQKLERFYAFYRDTLKFIGKGSLAEKYRMMVMLNYSLDGTAYGGDYDEVIGAFWVAPNRIHDEALNCVAHELGHSFQMQVHCDRLAAEGRSPALRQASDAQSQFIDNQDAEPEESHRWFGGGFFEMTSQWMLWHVNPYWQRDELFHWEACRRTPHKALLHWENVYHTPYVLEWWSQQHGLDIIARIYQTAHNPEDPVDAYMRLTHQDVEQFNDETFEAHRHTLFLDFKHAHAETRPYIGRWPQGDWQGAPEAGGFDARLMPTPARGERIDVDFEGLASSDLVGWRYGFVALLDDGSCLYPTPSKKSIGRVSFTAPRNLDVRELYLVVMGAPLKHEHLAHNGQNRSYPYSITVTSNQHLTSPNGRFVVDTQTEDGKLLSLTMDGQPLIQDFGSELQTTSKAGRKQMRLLKRETRHEHVDAFAYRQKDFSVTYNVATYCYNDLFDLEVRAYDEGIAYRFVQTARRPLVIEDESFSLVPAGDPVTYLAYSTNEKKPEAMAFQNVYTVDTLSQLPQQWAFLPVTMDFGRAKVTMLEADLEAYPGMFLIPNREKIKGVFAHYPKAMERYRWRGMTFVAETESFIAKTEGRRTLPWRVLCVTTDDRQMPTSNLVYALASPNRIGDTSWIQTGKSAWDWWHDWNLRGVPFRAGINMDTYRYYIDFAARNGLEYCILDEGWYDSNSGDLMHAIPDIDVQALVDYGRERGVGIVLWTVFNVLDEHLEEACKKYGDMGVKGFKVDFLDRDDQTAVEMAYRIADVCARHHLVLDYHGFYKPTGLNRTYPNVINFESVFGMEEVKWNEDRKDMPLYDVTFPFIRGMAGLVDYTPGAMRNGTRQTYAPVYSQPISMGTRCHQLAAYVVHDSPFTMLADAATSYEAEPDYTRFLASIPNKVDETLVLQGQLGKSIVVARRAGQTWWIGGMTCWEPRTIVLNDLLHRLGHIGTHTATLYADGPNADHNAEDYIVRQISVSDGEDVSVDLAPGGGFVMKIE